VPSIREFFETLASKVGDDPPELAFPKIVQELVFLAEALPVAWSIISGQRLGIYQGVLFGQEVGSKFFRRLEDGPAQKSLLGEYCLKKCGLGRIAEHLGDSKCEQGRLFFESGSTIAYVIGKFALALSNRRDSYISNMTRTGGSGTLASIRASAPALPASVITNNLIGITALSGLVTDVEPVQGRLDLKYYGFFPFGDDTPADRITLHREGLRYQNLADDVNQCSDVFATCSAFSFLLGPLVGSHANCVAKSAMYAGSHRWSPNDYKRFFLCFNFEKLVPLVDDYDQQLYLAEPQQCSQVFLPPGPESIKGLKSWLKQNANLAPLRNQWHDDILFNKKTIEIPISEMLTNLKNHKMKHSLLCESWFGWLGGGSGVNTLIALPAGETRGPAAAFLLREIDRINQIVGYTDWGFKYVVENLATVSDDGVAHVVIAPV
jgi:hypothetical protein